MLKSVLFRGIPKGAFTPRLQTRLPATRLSVASSQTVKFYSTPTRRNDNKPKFRYLVYTFLFSSACLVFVALQVDKKPPPKTNFSEKEFQEYEDTTHLKRRHKIVHDSDKDKVEFYVVPYSHEALTEEKISKRLKSSGVDNGLVKVIDPQQLIDAEIKDTSRKFLYLLQDLNATGKAYPKGLVTALVKENVREYLEQTKGDENVVKTSFFITNYPKNTDEAIKFENDVGDIKKCVVLHYDMLNELPKLGSEYSQLVNNVVGYFDTVGKAETVVTKWDEMDSKFEEIVLKDL